MVSFCVTSVSMSEHVLLCRGQDVVSEQSSCHVTITLQKETSQPPGQQGREVGGDEALEMTN